MKTWVYFADLLGNAYTFYVAITGTLLCIFTGMSLSWSSPVLEKLKLNGTDENPLGRPITQEENDLIGSVFAIGGAVGPLVLVYSLEYLGRKSTMTTLAVIFPIFHLTLAFSKSIYLYYICRVALGVAVGGSFSIVAIYVSEISSSKMRGTYLSLGTSFILTGGLLANTIGSYASIFNFNIVIVIAALIYIPLFVLSCPETLYYTMQKYGPDKTLELLKKLRRNNNEFEELQDIKNSVENKAHGTFLDVFRTKSGRRAFFICTMLLILQQLCGVTAIITYLQRICDDAKTSVDPKVASIIVSGFQTGSCLITPVAARFINRKILLSFSFAGVSVCTCLIGLYFSIDYLQNFHWMPLLALIFYVILYNCGLGPLPWAALGELYPSNIKSAGSAMSNSIYWVCQFIISYYFLIVGEAISFLIFSGVCFLSIFFVQIFLVETRGKTLQEIQQIMEE